MSSGGEATGEVRWSSRWMIVPKVNSLSAPLCATRPDPCEKMCSLKPRMTSWLLGSGAPSVGSGGGSKRRFACDHGESGGRFQGDRTLTWLGVELCEEQREEEELADRRADQGTISRAQNQ